MKKELCTERLTRQHELMEIKRGMSNPMQYSQNQDEKAEKLQCVHQGGQPRLQGWSVGCRTRWGALPTLTPALCETGKGEAEDFSGE